MRKAIYLFALIFGGAFGCLIVPIGFWLEYLLLDAYLVFAALSKIENDWDLQFIEDFVNMAAIDRDEDLF